MTAFTKGGPIHTLYQIGRTRPLVSLCTLALAVTWGMACSRASHDLTVWITDLEGNPIPGAMVGLSENGQTLLANMEGRVTWQELSTEQASLVVAAQGYVLQTAEVSLERGPNETTLALEKKEQTVPYQPPTSP